MQLVTNLQVPHCPDRYCGESDVEVSALYRRTSWQKR